MKRVLISAGKIAVLLVAMPLFVVAAVAAKCAGSVLAACVGPDGDMA